MRSADDPDGERQVPLPLVIVERDRGEMFKETYRPVFEYVGTHYHHAATSTFVDNRIWDVYAENARPVSSTREDGLPCYQ